MKKILAVSGLVLATTALAACTAASSSPEAPHYSTKSMSNVVLVTPLQKAKTYKNCTAMHKVWPHGVYKPGAKDRTSDGTVKDPQPKGHKSKALYVANKKSDRDKDGWACEKV